MSNTMYCAMCISQNLSYTEFHSSFTVNRSERYYYPHLKEEKSINNLILDLFGFSFISFPPPPALLYI